MGTLQTPDGPERIRGALVVEDPDSPGDDALVVVANSPIACDVNVEDDPATTRDEEAEAEAWWADSIAAAAYREGAVVVLLLVEDFLDEGERVLDPDETPWAAYRVHESGWEDGERVIYDYDLDRRGVGTAHVAPLGEDIELSFDVQGWSASVRAPRCSERALWSALLTTYYTVL